MLKTKTEQFVTQRRQSWNELNQLLLADSPTKASPESISRCAELYREVCTDLVRARTLGCPPTTLAYLDTLVSRGHSQIYAGGSTPFIRLSRLLKQGFPRALRANYRLFLIASVLFWLPFFVALFRSWQSEDFAAQVLPAGMLEQMGQSYQVDPSHGTSGDHATMMGFYVFNNVGIAFRCFATGILFGLGSAFFLVYNGALTGAVMGHVIRVGGGYNILTFISGHGPLELGAIVISGAAGLEMGRALVVTDGRTRLASLWASRQSILYQIVGAAFMLLLAALIEGFWSPSAVPREIKWAVGCFFVLILVSYLGFAGRSPRDPRKRTQKA
jgi:uncharacterized membrane protein SpoIIM required for sporulation